MSTADLREGIVSDRPVSLTEDLLWKNRDPTVRREIARMAKRIVMPLTAASAESSCPSMTFAIYGKWGMGKSSALRMLEDETYQQLDDAARRSVEAEVERRAKGRARGRRQTKANLRKLTEDIRRELDEEYRHTLAAPAGVDAEDLRSALDIETKRQRERLKFCRYPAPRYEAAQSRFPARFSLVYRMVLALVEGDENRALQKFGVPVLNFAPEPEKISADGKPGGENSRASWELQGIIAALEELMDYDRLLTKETSDAVPSRMLVVLIDDLDRCEHRFVCEVLNVIQELSDVRNLVFVLAVDRQRLREAMRRHTAGTLPDFDVESDPDYALEKYIQHSVELPPMDEEALEGFAKELLGQYRADPVASTLLRTDIWEIFLTGMLGGLRERTPRSAKRWINAVYPKLEHALDEAADEGSRLLGVKKVILQQVWPAFWEKYLEASLGASSAMESPPYRDALLAIEQRCFLWDQSKANPPDFEYLEFSVHQAAGKYLVPKAELPRELIRCLTVPPYWFFRPPPPGGAREQIREYGRESKAGPPEPTEDFMKLYFQSEAADKAGNADEAVALVDRLSQLVEANPTAFTAEQCPWVGNAAITAEKWDQDELATRLYQQAVALDPNHPNNLQNFVDFIINRQIVGLYDDAQRYLAKLKTGELASHRPDRTAAMEARLAARIGSGDANTAQVQEQVDGFLKESNPDQRRYVSLMSVLPEIGMYDAAEAVSRHYYGASDDRYLPVRSLADALASSGEDKYRPQAMEMYRQLLKDPEGPGQASVPDVQHNYATLLYAADYNEEAGRLWFKAYQSKPGDTQVRRSYVLYLMTAGRPDLAQLVFEGKPLGISEPVLQTEGKQVPEHFTDASVERWWEPPPPPV